MNIEQVWPEWHEDCVLGEGSFGKVFRAKRVEYGRTFYSAIKVLKVPKSQQEIKSARAQGMNDDEIHNYFQSLVDNLLNEITLMENLKGAQNIVGIEDYRIIEHEGEIGWDIFIRMELLTPFDSFVSNPEFSQKDVIKLGVDICTALEVCEQNYIIHRDIKPDNIFISRFGEYKLGDFGIARKLEATQANLSRKGTLNYMAPEVYKSEEYGTSVDIYSLGLVLYTLLNNNRIAFLPPYPQPITYKDNEEALAKRLSGTPIELPCNASASLGAAIAKACAYSPQDRYATATEFKNALIAEWNVLVQSGDNRDIRSDAMRFSNDTDAFMKHTTNDMTANGRLVVDEYSNPGTTALEQQAAQTNNGWTDERQVDYSYGVNSNQSTGNAAIKQQSAYQSTAKTNKFCRILAYPFAIAVSVLAAIVLLANDCSLMEKSSALAMLAIGITILISNNNHIAVGIGLAASAVGFLSEGLDVIVAEFENSFPIGGFVVFISGLIVMFSGITIACQKEARVGGSLCIYAIALEWIFNIYTAINGSMDISRWHIFFAVMEICAVLWSYGYDSRKKDKGIQKVLNVIAWCACGVVALQAVAFLLAFITKLF